MAKKTIKINETQLREMVAEAIEEWGKKQISIPSWLQNLDNCPKDVPGYLWYAKIWKDPAMGEENCKIMPVPQKSLKSVFLPSVFNTFKEAVSYSLSKGVDDINFKASPNDYDFEPFMTWGKLAKGFVSKEKEMHDKERADFYSPENLEQLRSEFNDFGPFPVRSIRHIKESHLRGMIAEAIKKVLKEQI